MWSLPTRERGLKYEQDKNDATNAGVAPYAGAWIEMSSKMSDNEHPFRRSLRGSVD